MYNHSQVKEAIKSIVPGCLIIPIYQITQTVVNCHIASKKESIYPMKNKEDIDEVIQDWHAKMKKGVFKKKSNENFYTVYTYLDEVIKDNK